jgi:hypothetical protein
MMHLLSTNEYEVKMIQKILLSSSRTFGYPLIEYAHFLSIQISAVTSQRTPIHTHSNGSYRLIYRTVWASC